jgi:polygalacturonase
MGTRSLSILMALMVLAGSLTILSEASSRWPQKRIKASISFNVMDFGARGDGNTDDSQAFLKTFSAACGTAGSPTITVPSGKTFLLSPILFKGGCKSSNLRFLVLGNLVAPPVSKIKDLTISRWIEFSRIEGLTFEGTGQIDGMGSTWWACRESKKCKNAPSTIGFTFCNNLRINGLTFKNSPKKQVNVNDCKGVFISKLTIQAPDESPNTDGIHVEDSQDVQIVDSNIGTGDDCISIGTNTANVNISGINCGPGHGISIGSLGIDGSSAAVEKIRVSHCKFVGTSNGARIKTWKGGAGYARDITFENLEFSSVDRAIVINQNYVDPRVTSKSGNPSSAVKISNVRFIQATGTSVKQSIQLDCSSAIPCSDIVLSNIKITSSQSNKPGEVTCSNVKGSLIAPVVPTLKFPCGN